MSDQRHEDDGPVRPQVIDLQAEEIRTEPDAPFKDSAPETPEERLARQLQRRMKARQPVFVVVKHSAGLMQYLDALKAHFPSLCFLVLGGAGLSDDDLEPGMRIIVPRLGPNEEADARESHEYVRGVLIKD